MPVRIDNIVPRPLRAAQPDLSAVGIPQVTQEQQQIDEIMRRMERQQFPTAISLDPEVQGPGQMSFQAGEFGKAALEDLTPLGPVSVGDLRDIHAFVKKPDVTSGVIAAAGMVPFVGGALKKALKSLEGMSLDEFVKSPPKGFRFDPDISAEANAHSLSGDITLGRKFFDLPTEGAKEHVINHEIGHALSDEWLQNGKAFDLADAGAFGPKNPETGLLDFGINGQFTPGENVAEAFSVYQTEPEFLRDNFPLAFKAIDDALGGKASLPSPSSMTDKEILDELGGGALKQGLKTLEKTVKANTGVDVLLSEKGVNQGRDFLEIEEIFVDAEKRGRGSGTEAMEQLTAFADQNNKHLILNADSSVRGGKRTKAADKRLVNFYKKHGFVENKGRNKDFSLGGPTQSGVMFRDPKAPLKDPSSMTDKEILEELNLFHQTAPENVAGIQREGFRIDNAIAAGSESVLPRGVFMKPTDEKIVGIGGDTPTQLAVKANIKNPLTVETRDDAKRFFSSDDTYRELNKKADIIDRQIAKAYDDLEAQVDFETATDAEIDKFFSESDKIFADGQKSLNETSRKASERAAQILKDKGHDGMVVNVDEGSLGRKVKSFIALDPSSVQLRNLVIAGVGLEAARQRLEQRKLAQMTDEEILNELKQ